MAEVPYRVVRSRRRTLSLEITRDGELLVRAPQYVSDALIAKFVADKHAWIEKCLAKRAAAPQETPLSAEELARLVMYAKQSIPSRVAHFAPLVGVTYERVSIRSQHSRWGSCSAKGNLNFNCLLLLTPPEVLDYVIVHELCHRIELNHSARFWAEVARVLPDYKAAERWLKDNGGALIRRLPRDGG